MEMVNKIFNKWKQCVHKKDLHTICTVFTVRKTSYAIDNTLREGEIAFFLPVKAHMLTLSHLVQQGRGLDHEK